jgi:hypothetical protein
MEGRAELNDEFFPMTRVVRIRIISGDEVSYKLLKSRTYAGFDARVDVTEGTSAIR